MKHIELAIKPSILYLLRENIKEKRGLSYINDKDFYVWLLERELISKMEYDRLIKEEK